MPKPQVLAALALGIIIGFAARSFFPSGSQAEVSKGTPPEARQAGGTTDATNSTGSPTTPLTALAPRKDGGPKGSDEPIVSITGENGEAGSINVDLARLGEAMEKSRRGRDEKRIALEMATLKDRLGLSEEQSAALRTLLEARAEEARGDGFELLNLLGGAPVSDEEAEALNVDAETVRGDDNFDAEVFALLDDEQKTAYLEYLEEARRNEIEANANRELAALQSMFTLTETQKDQALQAFADLATEGRAQAPLGSPISPEDTMRKHRQSRQSRIDALEPILTAEQMAVYEESPMASSAMFFMSDHSTSVGSGVTIRSIAIESPTFLDSSSPSAPEE